MGGGHVSPVACVPNKTRALLFQERKVNRCQPEECGASPPMDRRRCVSTVPFPFPESLFPRRCALSLLCVLCLGGCSRSDVAASPASKRTSFMALPPEWVFAGKPRVRTRQFAWPQAAICARANVLSQLCLAWQLPGRMLRGGALIIG